MSESANASSLWTRIDKMAAAIWLIVVVAIAVLPFFGFPEGVRRVGWGIATIAYECFVVVRTIQVKRYFCTALDLCGIALTYSIFFVCFQ